MSPISQPAVPPLAETRMVFAAGSRAQDAKTTKDAVTSHKQIMIAILSLLLRSTQEEGPDIQYYTSGNRFGYHLRLVDKIFRHVRGGQIPRVHCKSSGHPYWKHLGLTSCSRFVHSSS